MGAWEEIVDYTVPSNTTSVVLDNFGTITKDDFIKIHANIKNPSTSAGINISLFPNADTNNSNYYLQQLQANGSSVSAVRANQNGLTRVEPNIDASIFSYLKISENEKVNLFSNDFAQNNNLLRTKYLYTTSTSTFNNINQFTLTSNISNTLGAGSRIQIYRLTAQKVADITVASNTTQVDIAGLDIKKGDEYLLVSDMVSSGSSNSQINLCVNNNTNLSGYFRQVIVASGGGTGAERVNRAEITTLIQNARSLGYSHIKLSNIGAYTSQSYGMRRMGETILELENNSVSSTAENITSITQLNLFSSVSNAIGSGTRFQLYKLYEGGN